MFFYLADMSTNPSPWQLNKLYLPIKTVYIWKPLEKTPTSWKFFFFFFFLNTQPPSDLVGFMRFVSIFLSPPKNSCCVLLCCRGLIRAALSRWYDFRTIHEVSAHRGGQDQYFQVFWNSEAGSQQIIHKRNTLTANGTDSVPHPAQGREALFIMCLEGRESLTQWQLGGLES